MTRREYETGFEKGGQTREVGIPELCFLLRALTGSFKM